MSAEMVCDFCHAANPPHQIPCLTFVVDPVVPMPIGLRSRDDWWACDACFALIGADDQAALVKRALDCYFGRHPDESNQRDIVEAQVRRAYEQFWERRIRVQE